MKYVIFDLDGTLADMSHRLHYIQQDKPDWDAFFAACAEDKPITPMIELARVAVWYGHKLAILSGRNETTREETVTWLDKAGVLFDLLYMREEQDRRPDTELKQQWLREEFLGKGHEILFAVEDRKRVVAMYRNNGILCLQCADGDF